MYIHIYSLTVISGKFLIFQITSPLLLSKLRKEKVIKCYGFLCEF